MAGQNGGAREGSGRKLTGRRKVNLYITEEEERYLRAGLQKLREKEHQKLHTNLISGGEEIKEQSTGKVMRMWECKHLQSWGNGVKESPIAGQTVWCAWCQKMEKIEKVL